jgi:putative spermidine/putrescine transport system ATP-binding protein
MNSTPLVDAATVVEPDSARPEVVLAVRGLTKNYGDAVAVDNISFDLHRGEFLTLLGESGSGKSTTLMMVAGFETPTRGSIVLEGTDLTRMPAHKRGLGVVFQNYALFPNMTVVDNVAYPLKMRGVAKRERRELALEALAGVKLTSHAQYRVAELSGGQQQRVALARALVFKPAVLLMDEPLGALDKKLREHLQAELRVLHREQGVTVIYVTHDQDEALSLSDRIAVMRDGRIEQIGTPREIYAEPTSEFVADFVGESTLLTGTFNAGPAPELILESGQRVPLDDAARFDDGERVGLMLRPESVRFATAQDHSPRLTVRIDDRGYYGRDLRFECRGTADPFTSVVRVPQNATIRPAPGESVDITWDPSVGRVFTLERE